MSGAEVHHDSHEFVDEVEQAIEDYLFDPDSERVSTRFKADWLPVDEPTQKTAFALKQLQAEGVVDEIGKTWNSKTWRYLGDRGGEE